MELKHCLFIALISSSLLLAENQPVDGHNIGSSEIQIDTEWGLKEDDQTIENDITIIGTADGGLHALNSENKEIWSTNIPGGPLAQSFKAKSLGSMESSDDKGENFIVREMQQTYDGDGVMMMMMVMVLIMILVMSTRLFLLWMAQFWYTIMRACEKQV